MNTVLTCKDQCSYEREMGFSKDTHILPLRTSVPYRQISPEIESKPTREYLTAHGLFAKSQSEMQFFQKIGYERMKR